eukprot:m51a1_g757 putative peptidase t (409) ;mRNA; r:535707-537155
MMEEEVVERFMRYVRVHTTSDGESQSSPSTARQFDLARLLVDELRALGLRDARVDDHCVVSATLEASGSDASIALLAHLDTAEDAPGEGVVPVAHELVGDKAAGDLQLTGDPSVVIPAGDLDPYRGQTVITSSGTTLLGADDKAGLAIIMAALGRLVKEGGKHPRVVVLFTPDEEIGRGADHVDVKGLLASGVRAAYTIDGGAVGELECETFNATAAELVVEGVSVHPGYALGKMANAAQIAADFAASLPASERPETTSDRQGFIHLRELSGTLDRATAKFIVRDFTLDGEQRLIALMQAAAERARKANPRARVTLTTRRQYLNMRAVLDQHPRAVEAAQEAYERAGVAPVMVPVRGGTDGARLCEMGLPCPNIFAGGLNFHSKREFVPVESLVKGVSVVESLCRVWA